MMPCRLALLLALPLAAVADLEGRVDVMYQLEKDAPAVSWGKVCPYYPTSATPLTYDLSLKDGYVPKANLGYDWGVGCDLVQGRVGFLVQKNGTETVSEQIANLAPIPPVGCDGITPKAFCVTMLPVWIIVVIYMFYMMALTCDEFLVPSLNVLCARTGIPDDVAGATLMAAGCNGPELFAVVASTFIQPSTVGPGAILGSAPFNLMMIIAASTFAVGGTMAANPWLIGREILCLTCAVSTLIFVLRDGVVYWWEALIMIALYVCYVFVVVYTFQILGAFYTLSVRIGLRSAERVGPVDELVAPIHSRRASGNFEVGMRRASGNFELTSGMMESIEKIDKAHGKRRSLSSSFANSSGIPGARSSFHHRHTFDQGQLNGLLHPDPNDKLHDPLAALEKAHLEKTEPHLHRVRYSTVAVDGSNGTKRDQLAKMHKAADAANRQARTSMPAVTEPIVEIEINSSLALAAAVPEDLSATPKTNPELVVVEAPAHAEEAHHEEAMWYAIPDSYFGKATWIFTFWVKGILFYTVPNVHDPKYAKYYLLTLGLATLWLAAQAYVMTICLNYLGCALGISQIVMGNTLGAIGTSFPNLVASVITAKQGFAGMSVCQAIGSNTFNILIALGVNWFFQAIAGNCLFGSRSSVTEWCHGCFMPTGFQGSCPRAEGYAFTGAPGSILGSSLVVLVCLAIMIAALLCTKGKFTKYSAYTFILWYFLWLAYQILASFAVMKPICVAGDICV